MKGKDTHKYGEMGKNKNLLKKGFKDVSTKMKGTTKKYFTSITFSLTHSQRLKMGGKILAE